MIWRTSSNTIGVVKLDSNLSIRSKICSSVQFLDLDKAFWLAYAIKRIVREESLRKQGFAIRPVKSRCLHEKESL